MCDSATEALIELVGNSGPCILELLAFLTAPLQPIDWQTFVIDIIIISYLLIRSQSAIIWNAPDDSFACGILQGCVLINIYRVHVGRCQ
jgi:hypothetical protein